MNPLVGYWFHSSPGSLLAGCNNFIKRVNVTILGHEINLRDLNLWGQHWIVGGSSVFLLCPLVPGLRKSLLGVEKA